MGYTNTTKTTTISGWSGSNGRVFTLKVVAGPVSGTQWTATITASVNNNDTVWYDSHMNVYEYDVDQSKTWTQIDQTAGWNSGVWFTRPGTSSSWTDTWTRTDSNRNVRVYIKGYVAQYSDKSSYVSFTIPAKKSITVTFNGNGATSNTFGTQTYKEGNSNQSFVGTISRTGYTMLGWAASSTATTQTWSTNSGVSDSWIWDNAPTKTIYAVWKANTYNVTYNANGSTSGSAPAAQTKTHDTALTLRTNTGNLAKTGYTLAGWNTKADGTGTHYALGGSYTANAAVTLYAEWQLPKTIWIWNGSAWKQATPWIWNGSAWKQATPWIWNGSAWK